jgi:hypothetical protein
MARRFTVCSIIAAAGFAALAVAPAYGGDTAPSIVIPSRPGIPVVINGRDASYAVVEGDWGLARPGHVPVTVYGGSPIRPNPVYEPRNRYIPRYGHAPPRGRNEAEPPGHAGAEPAEGFSRNWSSSSDMSAPASIVDPTTYYRPDTVVPYDYRRRNRRP